MKGAFMGQDSEKGTVLCVDDEPDIREIVAMHASSLGFDVLEAGDGLQAQEVVKSHQVDVIVSDLMMPRVSGLSLLSDLREAGFLQPFIIVTAYPSQDSTLQALRLGAFDYLEKPFEADELKSLLKEAMRVSKGLDASTKTQEVPSVAAELQKLKTLRYDSESPATPSKVPSPSNDKMVDLFVDEAMPQLLFCEGAIKGLLVQEERSFELGYLFRVMQALTQAAKALGADDFARLSGAAELFYTTLRVRPRVVNDSLVDLAKRTNAALQTSLNQIRTSPGNANDALIAELQKHTRALEGGLEGAR
jgi:CheY-like chemotaxis protein